MHSQKHIAPQTSGPEHALRYVRLGTGPYAIAGPCRGNAHEYGEARNIRHTRFPTTPKSSLQSLNPGMKPRRDLWWPS